MSTENVVGVNPSEFYMIMTESGFVRYTDRLLKYKEMIDKEKEIIYDIKSSDIANLRKETGCGIIDCRKALIKAFGDHDTAKEIININTVYEYSSPSYNEAYTSPTDERNRRKFCVWIVKDLYDDIMAVTDSIDKAEELIKEKYGKDEKPYKGQIKQFKLNTLN